MEPRISRKYTCSGCGAASDEWPDGWSWFGSQNDLDEWGVEGVGITCGAAECNAAAERHVTRRAASPKRATARKSKVGRIRDQALAKLTTEEREALGLWSDAAS